MAVSIVIDITQNSQSIADNTSNVTVKVNAKWTGGSYNQLEKSGSCTIDGTKYTFTSPFNTGQTTSGSCNLFTKTLNITHGSDGTKTLAVSASYTSGVSSGTVAASASKALTTIPRKSTLSVADGTLGTSQTLTVTRRSPSFTHSIKAVCGSSTVYIKADGTTQSSESKHNDTSIPFTPPLSWASQNTTGTSVSVKFTITTYNGTSKVGENSYTKTFAIPASVKPSCTVAVTDAMGYFAKYGAYVQNKSKFKVTVTPTLAYGSPIKSYNTTLLGSSTNPTFTTNLITQAGEHFIAVYVIDSRGRFSDTITVADLTVVEYSAPQIPVFTAKRVDADGTPNPKGAYAEVTISASVSPLNNKNTASYKLEYKKTSVSSWNTATVIPLDSLLNSYETQDFKHIFPAETSSSYDVRLTITDDFGDVPVATTLSTASRFISQRAGGKGIAFGKEAEEDGAAEFGFIMRSTHGELLSSPFELPEGTDLDELLTEGHYTIGNTTLSSTILNKPFWYANTNSTANIYVTRAGDGAQKIQRYYPCVKGEQFEFQRIYYTNSWSDWMITGGCTEWKSLTIASGFEVYTEGSTEPKYRVNGNMVTVMGAVKPTAQVTSNTTGVTFASGIASQYRPAFSQQFVCQGSGINRWVFSITTAGALTVSRYGTNDYVNIPAGAWLIFTATYSI